MELSLRRWRPGQILASWAAYWTGLVGVKLGPAIAETWRVTSLPDGHGTVTAGLNDNVLTYTVIRDGVTSWTGSVPVGTALLWVIGPPLVLWVLWLALRRRDDHGQSIELLRSGSVDAALPPGMPPVADWRPKRDDRVAAQREPLRTPDPSA